MKEKDWRLKVRLEEELQIHPSYGSRRLARALGLCRQRAQRVMRLFGIKPYRRRGRKWRKSKVSRIYPNLLLAVMPAYANHIWAADFTELVQHGKKVYVATVLDLYTRRILGIQVTVRKGAALTIQALSNALLHHPRPGLFHSDNVLTAEC
jgi:putative transposase